MFGILFLDMTYWCQIQDAIRKWIFIATNLYQWFYNFKYLKYILGVNKKSTNLAVLSELGRYPLYFSVVLSMLKYWFRIDKMESDLLSDAYIANQSMVSDNTECWLSSIKFILQKLNIQHTGIKLNELAWSVRKKNYAIVFFNYWNKKSK